MTSTPDLLDRIRDGRLGLRRAHRTESQSKRSISRSRNDVAEALEGAVAPLRGGEGDDVADLRVVDGVLDAVGQHRVAVGHVERQVELQPLADLLLGVADAVVRIYGEAADLDLHGECADSSITAKVAGRERVSRSWSHELQHHYADLEECRVHYVSRGEGKPLLFLHGFPQFWFLWREQLADLGNDHAVYAPGHAGLQPSCKPEDPEAYRMRHLLRDIVGLVESWTWRRSPWSATTGAGSSPGPSPSSTRRCSSGW